MSETTVVYGSSDDLIEVDGMVTDEFPAMWCSDDQPRYLAFSDGTVIRVIYSAEGCWELRRVEVGTAQYAHKPHDDDRTTYSDRVTLTGPIAWVVMGTHHARSKKAHGR